VDSGNLLYKQPNVPVGTSREQLTAEGIITIYTTLKVDAVAVGPLDLAAGLALLQTSHKKGFPWLSANLLDQKGRPLFQTSRIKKIGKIKVGVIGMTGAVSTLPAGITRSDWQTALPSLIEKTGPQCDLLILLSSLTPAENREIALRFPTLHLILTNIQDSGNMNPQQINNTLITQTDRQGKYQGILTIDWNKSGRWGRSPEEELSSLRNRLGTLDWQIQHMLKQQESQHPDYLEKIKLTERDKSNVEQQIKALEQQTKHPAKDAASSFSHNFLALNRNMPESSEIQTIIDRIKQQLNGLQASLK
jgi:2',3'-cyclic-nucleotide 2'-phosphodiesterase (5'-nucleotidase family)